jgi:dTDP-3-amino-3,4,6-trideoxy-alpha-D-glucose transaminase
MNLDSSRIRAAITPRTRAILAVHLYGQPAEMTSIMQIAREHDLLVVQDAAQAHGARYEDRGIGKWPHAVAYSFYPTKNLGAIGDAGAVITDDEQLADQVRLLRNYGSRTKYSNETKGVNSRLDSLQAAFLRVKLKHLDQWNERRRQCAEMYLDQLAGLPRLRLPALAPGASAAWHLFVIRHPERDALREALSRSKIETLVHYPVPPHLSGAYADAGWKAGDFPITEEIANTALSLPIGPHLPLESVGRVVEAVRRFCHQ